MINVSNESVRKTIVFLPVLMLEYLLIHFIIDCIQFLIKITSLEALNYVLIQTNSKHFLW